MSIEGFDFDILGLFGLGFGLKAFLILFAVFYSVFALILYRQIQLMGRALPTSVVPFLRFVAIVHLGFSVALLFIIIGIF